VHKMHPDTIDPGPEVTEPVQPAFLRAPVKAVRPVRQQVPQVTEVCTLLPRRTWPRPRPSRVSDPRTQVGEDLVAHPDTELLRPEGCHPASLARYRHLERPWLTGVRCEGCLFGVDDAAQPGYPPPDQHYSQGDQQDCWDLLTRV